MKKAEATQDEGMAAFFICHLMLKGLCTYDPSKSSSHNGWPLPPLFLCTTVFLCGKD